MLFYRAALPLSRKTLTFVAGIIRRHRRAIGSLWQNWIRASRPARSPRAEAPQGDPEAKKADYAYVIVDGTLIPTDRVAGEALLLPQPQEARDELTTVR